VLFITILILLIPLTLAYFNETPQSIEEVANYCKGKNLSESTSCVVKITSKFYKYNLDNIGREMTFEQLKEEGGVCSSWSDYYSQIGELLGYKSRNITIPLSKEVSHEFSVWSDENGYCILDQTEVSCFDLN
jgi:hypothetical protein